MATKEPVKPATQKTPKPTISIVERVKAQLSTAALKGKVSADELSALENHLGKLKALLS